MRSRGVGTEGMDSGGRPIAEAGHSQGTDGDVREEGNPRITEQFGLKGPSQLPVPPLP